ncbi:hypothetical protein [Methanomethylovorans sp.]
MVIFASNPSIKTLQASISQRKAWHAQDDGYLQGRTPPEIE